MTIRKPFVFAFVVVVAGALGVVYGQALNAFIYIPLTGAPAKDGSLFTQLSILVLAAPMYFIGKATAEFLWTKLHRHFRVI